MIRSVVRNITDPIPRSTATSSSSPVSGGAADSDAASPAGGCGVSEVRFGSVESSRDCARRPIHRGRSGPS
jgi:hypothetical protein